jgi:hypothetical protein
MARKARVEVEDGLYHVIARGVYRQLIFHGPDESTCPRSRAFSTPP